MMSPEELAHIIQLMLAPTVLISACALTLNGVMNHFQAVSGRLRSLAHERIQLLQQRSEDEWLAGQRLKQIDREAPDLLRRHQLIHLSMLAIAASMACLVLHAGHRAGQQRQPSLNGVVLSLFLASTVLLLVGLLLSAADIALARRALHYELKCVLELKRES